MNDLDLIFKALADGSRIRIANLLLYGESCVCELQDILGASQPKISRHLAYLKNSGWIEDRRDGNRVFYQIRPELRRKHRNLLDSIRRSFLSSPVLKADLVRLKRKLSHKKTYFNLNVPLTIGRVQGRIVGLQRRS